MSSYGQGQGQPGWLTRTDTLPESSRRRKFAGYLKAANELRQTYQSSAATAWKDRNVDYGDSWEHEDSVPGGFPEAVVASGSDRQMILFPSYARKHIKRKPRAVPGTVQQTAGAIRDVRDSPGAGDAEFWREEWEKYEDDHAIVDVDVRGWVYTPHKGPMNRKQRIFIGLARQLAGLPGMTEPGQTDPGASKPAGGENIHQHVHTREKLHEHARKHEEAHVQKEAENILREGEAQAHAAAHGVYSEKPRDSDGDSLADFTSRESSPGRRKSSVAKPSPLAQVTSSDRADRDVDDIKPLQARESWHEPVDMTATELKSANSHLMRRLRPFLANPMADSPISAFFYNEDHSQQRTIHTDASGHFVIRAPLEFIPTHVRILASEDLSATEEVIVTEPHGVSVISDIDDTIKHSAIGSGAREIFRNAFIRELGDLIIDGVQDWYANMAKLGVKFHYVSNSPWQLYPVLTKYFALAGLPPGSFHLKQYSGMLQGIFEPVAERKKGTLDRLARDFPERSFILVGDSGEADIEVYTDFVLENPGRVLGVFIRDVTTSPSRGFFTPSVPSTPRGSRSQRTSPNASPRATPPNGSPRLGPARDYGNYAKSGLARNAASAQDQEEADLQAAIKASLRDLEEDEGAGRVVGSRRASSGQVWAPNLPPRRPSGSVRNDSGKSLASNGDLIDLRDDVTPSATAGRPNRSLSTAMQDLEQLSEKPNKARGPAPPPPRKPQSLQQPSPASDTLSDDPQRDQDKLLNRKSPPPKPRRPSSNVVAFADQRRESEQVSSGGDASGGTSVIASVGQKLNAAYNAMPEVRSRLPANPLTRPTALENGSRRQVLPPPSLSASSTISSSRRPAPLPPPRLGSTASAAGRLDSVSPSLRPAYSTRAATDRVGGLSRTATSNSVRSSYTTASDDGGYRANTPWDGQSQLSKKEALWQQRLTHASRVLRDKGVVLKVWRVGGDVEGECMALIKEALEREKDA